MSDPSRIRINALLLQREALFVRVHEIERTVNGILGEPWPFERPPLPSDRRAKAKPAGKRAAANDEPKLRRLDDTTGETAYRVTYLQRGQTREEIHDTPDALQTLLAAQGAQLQVRSIETLDPEGEVVARLHPPA